MKNGTTAVETGASDFPMLLSTFLDLLTAKLHHLTKRKTVILLICVFFLVVFINGVSTMPFEAYLALSQNPFVTRTDIAESNYFQESILLPVIAYALHFNSQTSFYMVCLLILLSAYGSFAYWTYRSYDAVIAFVLTTILITSPITTVLFSWIGAPDGITFALSIPFLFISSPILLFLLAVIGTTNHLALFIAASEILLLRWVAGESTGRLQIAAIFCGGAVGVLAVRLFLFLNGIDLLTTRLGVVFSVPFQHWLQLNLYSFPTNVFSLFNVYWLAILICLIMFFNADRRYYASLLLIIVLNYAIAFFTLDATRIFSLISWGVLMHCIFHSYKLANRNHSDQRFKQQFLMGLLILVMVSLISPRYFTWGGVLHNPIPIQEILWPIRLR